MRNLILIKILAQIYIKIDVNDEKHLLKFRKILANLRKFTEMYTEIYENVRKYTEMYENVRKCAKMYEHVRNVQTCPKI